MISFKMFVCMPHLEYIYCSSMESPCISLETRHQKSRECANIWVLNNWNSGYIPCKTSLIYLSHLLLRTGAYFVPSTNFSKDFLLSISDVFISQPSRHNSDMSLLCQPFARINAFQCSLILFLEPFRFGITYLMMHFSYILLTALSLTLHLFSCQ